MSAEPEQPELPKLRVEGDPRAVALRYERGRDRAPEVVAKGRGEIAAKILELAREAGVPVREDRDLLQLLAACEVGDEIPEELWVAVAEVLAFLFELNAESDAR